jgi:hypothetical protein
MLGIESDPLAARCAVRQQRDANKLLDCVATSSVSRRIARVLTTSMAVVK